MADHNPGDLTRWCVKMKGLDEKSFFDGLPDAMIEYVEKHGAFAGLSMSHREYVDDDTEGADGKKAT